MTKKLLVLLDGVLDSTARTVRATALILVLAVAAGPLHAVQLPMWPTPSAVAPAAAKGR